MITGFAHAKEFDNFEDTAEFNDLLLLDWMEQLLPVLSFKCVHEEQEINKWCVARDPEHSGPSS